MQVGLVACGRVRCRCTSCTRWGKALEWTAARCTRQHAPNTHSCAICSIRRCCNVEPCASCAASRRRAPFRPCAIGDAAPPPPPPTLTQARTDTPAAGAASVAPALSCCWPQEEGARRVCMLRSGGAKGMHAPHAWRARMHACAQCDACSYAHTQEQQCAALAVRDEHSTGPARLSNAHINERGEQADSPVHKARRHTSRHDHAAHRVAEREAAAAGVRQEGSVAVVVVCGAGGGGEGTRPVWRAQTRRESCWHHAANADAP